jgi:hypothetical protein
MPARSARIDRYDQRMTFMTSASHTPDAPSALHTGLSAGKSLLAGLALGLVLATVLGGGSVAFYLLRLMGSTEPGLAKVGPIGMLSAPPVLVALVLVLSIPAYAFAGVQLGRTRASRKLVQRYGPSLSQHLAELLAKRIEALPGAHKALHKTADLLSPDTAMEYLQPWVGNGRAVRLMVHGVLQRLPVPELLEEWQHQRAQWDAQAQPNDPALRAFLGNAIHDKLTDLSTPSLGLLGALMAVHAAVLGLGLWLTA